MSRYERGTASDHIAEAGDDMADGYVPYSGEVVTRKEAKAAGLTRYFTGNPCPHGHISQRSVSSMGCRTCAVRTKRAWEVANGAVWRAKVAANAALRLDPEWQAQHKLNVAAQNAELYRKNKDRYKANSDAWYAANREEKLAKNSQWYADNKEHCRLKKKEWCAANPEYRRASKLRRRAREAGAAGAPSAADIKFLMGIQKSRCAYCQTSLKSGFHTDHIVPLFLGGSGDRRNLQLTCPSCNLKKARHSPEVFARRMGRLI